MSDYWIAKVGHDPRFGGAQPRVVGGATPRAHAGAAAAASAFSVIRIPGAMDKLKWTGAARLMRRWFSLPPRAMTTAEKNADADARRWAPEWLDETTISMTAILGFGRVKTVYDDLFANYANPAARNVLREKLVVWVREHKIAGNALFRFGDLSQPAKVIDATCSTNFRRVGSLDDPYDDFYGAIGRGVLKVAVTGMARMPAPGQFQVRIDEVAVYLRDTYDFEGDQFLGYWNDDGVSFFNPFTATRINNESFRDWRAANRRGGDFTVFSSVLRTPVSPATVTL